MTNCNKNVVYGKELELRECDPFCPKFEPQSRERLLTINTNECVQDILSTHHKYYSITNYEEDNRIYEFDDDHWNKVIITRRVRFEDLNCTGTESVEKVETPEKKNKLKSFKKCVKSIACCLWQTVTTICCCTGYDEDSCMQIVSSDEESDSDESVIIKIDNLDCDVLYAQLEYDMKELILDFVDKALDMKFEESDSDDSIGTPILAINNLETNSELVDKKVALPPYLETHF